MTSPAAKACPNAEIWRKFNPGETMPTHMHQVDRDTSPFPDLTVAHDDARTCSKPFWHLRIGITQYSREKHISNRNGRDIVKRRDVEVKCGRGEKGGEESSECSTVSLNYQPRV